MLFRCFLVLLCTSLPAQAAAQSQNYDVRPQANRVTGEDLAKSFKGITHKGAYNFDQLGRAGNNYTEQHHKDGKITYREKGEVLTGRWRLTPEDTICYSYENANLGPGCFRVYKIGTCYYFYASYLTARKDESDQEYWTARSVEKGKSATCLDMFA